jgi:hypothetical protein
MLKAHPAEVKWLRAISRRFDKCNTRRKFLSLKKALEEAAPLQAPPSRNIHVVRLMDTARETVKGGADWGNQFDMVSMYFADAADYIQLALLIREGALLDAYNHIWDMDTAARDMIHYRTFQYLEKIGNKYYDREAA